jgi:hypothetical protein
MTKLARSPRRTAAFLVAALCALAVAATDRAAAQPAPDPTRNCFDGGRPYKVGAHLCPRAGAVLICLAPNQSYGLHGAYVYAGRDKAGLRFDKAHWVETNSPRCDREGKVYY